MKKIITKATICLTLLTICFAGENIEPDVEKGIASVKMPSCTAFPSISVNEELKEQIFQTLPATTHNLDTAHENNVRNLNNPRALIWNYILVPAGKFIYDYGAQTASGLTVLGVWYRYLS